MNKYTGTVNLEVMSDAVNYNRFLTELVLSQAKLGDRILDLGAGIGTFAERISKQGFNVCCVEPDPSQAAVITNLRLSVFNDLSQIENNSLDYVYTLNVLEHIEDDRAILCELYSKLKPSGRLLIYVPAFQILYSSMDQKVGHYRRYTRKGLNSIVTQAGFNVIETRYADSLGFFATILYKLVGDNTGMVNTRALIMYDRFVFPLSRIVDILLGAVIGKNVLLVATKRVKISTMK
jgi:SAM-dependent methyltransferase